MLLTKNGNNWLAFSFQEKFKNVKTVNARRWTKIEAIGHLSLLR